LGSAACRTGKKNRSVISSSKMLCAGKINCGGGKRWEKVGLGGGNSFSAAEEGDDNKISLTSKAGTSRRGAVIRQQKRMKSEDKKM